MTEKVDSGPIIAFEDFKISKSCSMPMLLAKIAQAVCHLLCSIPSDINKAELLKRVHAFGSGDGISQVHLWVDQDKYLLVNDQDFFIGEAIKTLHGISFKRHGS
jgi:hypothetical protein